MTTSTGTEPDRNRIDAVNEGSLSAALAARVKLRALDRLILPPHDASSHTPQSLQKLSSTVAAIGIEPPILITKQGVVVAGLGRVNAAKSLGLSEVACIDIEEMSEIERRGYIHAHQKLALASGWDESLLATESLTLPEAIAPDRPGQLIGGMTSADETVPLSSEGDTTTRAGDVWLFGQHRLSCGSAEALEPYRQVMGDLRAGLVFTHPLCSAAAHGEASPPFLTTVFTRLAAYTSDDAILFACSDWRHMKDVLDAGSATFGPPANVIVWLKDLDGKGEFCDSGHELIFAFQKQSASSSGSDQSRLSYGRDVWRHRGGPELHFNAFGEAMVLPTVRPVGLVSDAIAEFSEPGGIVLDAFCGSGTTLIAAERTGRRAFAIEADPSMCDRSLRRWQHHAGGSVRLLETGETFEMVAERRAGQLRDEPAEAGR